MKKILLTGGNGFIGRNIRESFLSEKYELFAPSRNELDLLDENSVKSYFTDKFFDVVIHCAIKPAHRNAKDLTNIMDSNVKMFDNLVLYKDKFKKFINIGSGAVYGTSTDITDAKEDERFSETCNSFKKPLKELDLVKLIIAKKIESLENFVDLNIFGIFGKYEDWEIRFISNAICKTLFNMPITLRQNRRFSYLYIDDLMPILEFFIENNVKYNSYNIVPDEKIELLQIAEIVRKISKKNIDIIIASGGYGLDYTGNNSRLKDEFPQLKFTNTESAISALYNYYKDNLDIVNRKLLLADK